MPFCNYCNADKDVDHWRMGDPNKGQINRRKDCRKRESDQRQENKRKIKSENNGDVLQSRITEIMKFVKKGPVDRMIMVAKIAVYINQMARGEFSRLGKITKDEFYRAIPHSRKDIKKMGITFEEAHKVAVDEVKFMLGYNYPTESQLGDGTYLIVGDSFGKHTKSRTFQLIRNMQDFFHFKNIIHVGQFLDDDGVYSYYWGHKNELPDKCPKNLKKPFDNVIVLSKREEIRQLVRTKMVHRDGWEPNFKIIRDKLYLGDLCVQNQDMFVDNYTRVGIKSVEQSMFNTHTLFNFPKHEMDSKTTPEGQSLLHMGCGALADPFVIKTKVMFDWKGGHIKREVWTDGFKVYRKRDQFKEMWEMGCYIVVVKNGHFTPIPLRIYDIDKNDDHPVRGVGIFNKVITNEGVHDAEHMTLVTGDHHAPMHDPMVHSIIEALARQFKFDTHVNLGDFCHFNSVNHHNIEAGKIQNYMNEDTVQEAGTASYLLGLMESWAPERYMIFANHERFTRDFIEKNPQFKTLLDVGHLLELKRHGITLKEHLTYFNMYGSGYTHGDLRMYGAVGNKQEKIARVYGGKENPVFIGHIHYPSIRLGCYSVGLAGKLDQLYNEASASRWMHGVGSSTFYRGVAWNTTIPIMDNRLDIPQCMLRGNYPLLSNMNITYGKYMGPKKVNMEMRYSYE